MHFNALFIALRIAAACHNYAGTALIFPLDIEVGELFIINCLEDIAEVCIEERKNDLSFGVAEAAVILDNFYALWCCHKSEVETAFELSALGVHCIHCREEDIFHTFLCNGFGIERVRSDSSHSARVKSLVAVESALMIH